MDFRLAYGNRLVAVALAKPPVSGKRAPEQMTNGSVSARRKIERIIDGPVERTPSRPHVPGM
jgi:hypothetical protein